MIFLRKEGDVGYGPLSERMKYERDSSSYS
jgi:hypothetical protein